MWSICNRIQFAIIIHGEPIHDQGNFHGLSKIFVDEADLSAEDKNARLMATEFMNTDR